MTRPSPRRRPRHPRAAARRRTGRPTPRPPGRGPLPARTTAPDTPPTTSTGTGTGTGTGSRLDYANSAIGAGSFVLGLMLYAGYLYVSAFYDYFRLGTFAVGFDSFEFALRSLRLVTLPVLTALALLFLVPHVPELLALLRVPERHLRRVRGLGRAVARLHLPLIATGVSLMLAWPRLGSFQWAAPVCVAGGLLLGQSPAAVRGAPGRRGRRPRPWERAVAVVVAGAFLMWVVALAAGELGRRDARHAADHLVTRVAVVVLSEDRLSMTGPGLVTEDLGKGLRYRYRYSGLRLLVERDHRYYLLPLRWRHDRDATFVIEDDDSVRVELRPGVRAGARPGARPGVPPGVRGTPGGVRAAGRAAHSEHVNSCVPMAT
ncbi:hypothetical protein [Streptomyces sp. G45]|uniref:hypothetical protein n=1 Tax=Streptomyces sp. G45 TaxID=3406627 RepID=UPI003C26D828